MDRRSFRIMVIHFWWILVVNLIRSRPSILCESWSSIWLEHGCSSLDNLGRRFDQISTVHSWSILTIDLIRSLPSIWSDRSHPFSINSDRWYDKILVVDQIRSLPSILGGYWPSIKSDRGHSFLANLGRQSYQISTVHHQLILVFELIRSWSFIF